MEKDEPEMGDWEGGKLGIPIPPLPITDILKDPANIPDVLKVGDKIEIGGKIKENARKMSVNLCAQEGEEPRDVVLHFDVRFHRDNIISLSRKNGVWIGSGNYDTNYNMFVPGTIFRIVFEIKDTDVITIYCQGKFHSNFLPKIPLKMAKYIVAWSDVERITHCYFNFANKIASGDDIDAPGVYIPQPPRSPMVSGDTLKRGLRIPRQVVPGSPQFLSSEESSEDEEEDDRRVKSSDGRADRCFYDTLMCQKKDHARRLSPELVRRRNSGIFRRSKLDYTRKCAGSDTEKNNSEDFSDDQDSKNNDTSLVESVDPMQELCMKKRNRKGKFGAPFAQVVNFMGKTAKKN